MYVLEGLTHGPRSLKINDPNITTLKTALLTRMYYCEIDGAFVEPPVPGRGLVRRKLSEYRSLMCKYVGRATTISAEEFVDMYRGRKRTIYTNALEEYYDKGPTRQHSRSIAFVKCEKVNPKKAPRCIQPRHPVYNIGVGRYLKHLEHQIYRTIDRIFGSPTVMSGYNVVEIGGIAFDHWSSFCDPVGVGLDATKFDMHVNVDLLRWEHSIYLELYNWDPNLKQLLEWQVHNIGAGYCDDGWLTYKVEGRRFSGDMNTAMGNKIIMTALVYAYAKERNITIRLMNNGDDCMVFMERRDLHRFVDNLDKWFLEFGMRMCVEEPVFDLQSVEFCQMRPIRLGGIWTMVRNIDTAREKDTISIIPLDTEKACRKWMHAVGTCGLALCDGMPIMTEFYQYYVRNGIASNMKESVAMQSGMMRLSEGLKYTGRPITDEARYDVFVAWGITPDEQTAIEEHIRELVFTYEIRPIEDLEDCHMADL